MGRGRDYGREIPIERQIRGKFREEKDFHWELEEEEENYEGERGERF